MTRPVTWTIAGTDPSGGAGIQADIKTMQELGTHACAVITAVIAQNTQGVDSIEYPSEEMVAAQLRALQDDVPPAAVKLGMLSRTATVREIIKLLPSLQTFTVWDPVLASSSGTTLLEDEAVVLARRELLPLIDLLTPNIPEAERLTGIDIKDPSDMKQTAIHLLGTGVGSVLLKGGHRSGALAQDYWTNGQEEAWFSSPALDSRHTHGTGCTLSSAIAACVARGYALLDALVIAKTYVTQGIRMAGGIGKGSGPVAHEGWPAEPADLPALTASAEIAERAVAFPVCPPKSLGLYPLVDSAARVDELMGLGVQTVQLRLKDLLQDALRREIFAAAEAARNHGGHLFVNDYWELAAEAGAYGTHLGQEDLRGVDPAAIQATGLRLGTSTHGYAELARVACFKPSYIAVGTVFPSPSKPGLKQTLGVDELARLTVLSPVPVVAIGGITLDNAAPVLETGVAGVAVISDIARAANIADRVAAWKQMLSVRDATRQKGRQN
jgi:hydroxymethylpyrimidine kinase/phosphomethylpyrimidine kinase/thiamine-phosphate diphosphorylase